MTERISSGITTRHSCLGNPFSNKPVQEKEVGKEENFTSSRQLYSFQFKHSFTDKKIKRGELEKETLKGRRSEKLVVKLKAEMPNLDQK